MIVMTDRWSCPDCSGTTVRPAGITDRAWHRRRKAAQLDHAKRHNTLPTAPAQRTTRDGVTR